MITVRKLDDTRYEVIIRSRAITTHSVSVDPTYYQRLTGGRVSPERLVEESFVFLLEREPNTSILRSFDLPVISRYFPEYETTIQKRLK